MVTTVQPLSAPPRWIAWCALATAILAFLPTLGGGFLGDDFIYIARFREFPWSQWPRLFTQDWSGGVWGMQLHELRPFAALSFLGDAHVFGGHALGYRLTNLAFHLFSTAVVVRLAWRYSRGHAAAALMAGLVFALHPAHAEAVAWITGRVDLQATAAGLLFWLGAECFAESGRLRHFAATILAFFVGVFSKELCMFAPLLLLLHWLLVSTRMTRETWRRRLLIFIAVAVVFAFYAWCRRVAFGGHEIGVNLWRDGPAWQRQADYIGWLLPVLPLSGHAEWREFPSLAALHGSWLAVAAVILVGLATARLLRRTLAANLFFFAGVWYLVSVFPLTGVSYFSPRHLYFPTAGLALGVGLACAGRRWRSVLGGAFVLWCVAAHVAALGPWRAAGTVSQQAVATLDRELAQAPAGTIALTAVPEIFHGVWLWSWASPACVQPPFLTHPPAQVIERQGNYARTDQWFAERKPLETVRAAPAAVALFVDDEGRIACRRVDRGELQRRADDLARAGAGGISVDVWTAWVKSLASPPP